MAYIPHTDAERRRCWRLSACRALDELYQAVPADVRFPDLDLPEPFSELEIIQELRELAEANVDTQHFACFLGAGAYNHFIPAASTTCCGAASSTPPTRPTSPRSARARCRRSSSTRP